MINYLILAHKNLSQLDRLVTRLNHPSTTFTIHIDKKVPAGEISKYRFYRHQRVRLIRNRFSVNWGGFSMVLATIRLMQAASENGRGYYVLLSGQDFPLRSNDYIHNFLADSYGREYVDQKPMPRAEWENGGMDRLNYHWLGDIVDRQTSDIFVFFQMHHKIVRPYFKDFQPYGGSQWWSLTYDCVKYILEFIRHNQIMLDYFKTCLCPDFF